MMKRPLLPVILTAVILLVGGVWIAARGRQRPPAPVQESAEPTRPSPIDDTLPRPPLEIIDDQNSVRTRLAAPSKVDAKAAEPPKDLPGTNWAVVAAIYNKYEAAEERARSVSGFHATVFPSKGEGSKYMVLLGSGLSYASARSLRDHAAAAGLPPDTYVTKLSISQR
jgi:hypothetical protein